MADRRAWLLVLGTKLRHVRALRMSLGVTIFFVEFILGNTVSRMTSNLKRSAVTAGEGSKLVGRQVETTAVQVVNDLFRTAMTSQTITKSGWCLKEGMIHVLNAEGSGLLETIVLQRGLPNIYSFMDCENSSTCRHETSSTTKPQNCFQSLCRIIAGQQLAGMAARSIWLRFVDVVTASSECQILTPESVLNLAEKGIEQHLQTPSGLSRAKSLSIVALAEAFEKGNLTETFLTSPDSTEEDIRNVLLTIKGIGPWTCDMFLLFYLEKSNVLPIGDLGVRKGIAKFFGLKGTGQKGSLCQVKDKAAIESVMAPYHPYMSLVTYYMWAVADAKDFNRDCNNNQGIETEVDARPSRNKRSCRQRVGTTSSTV